MNFWLTFHMIVSISTKKYWKTFNQIFQWNNTIIVLNEPVDCESGTAIWQPYEKEQAVTDQKRCSFARSYLRRWSQMNHKSNLQPGIPFRFQREHYTELCILSLRTRRSVPRICFFSIWSFWFDSVILSKYFMTAWISFRSSQGSTDRSQGPLQGVLH